MVVPQRSKRYKLEKKWECGDRRVDAWEGGVRCSAGCRCSFVFAVWERKAG
jgi:hypothetical protein